MALRAPCVAHLRKSGGGKTDGGETYPCSTSRFGVLLDTQIMGVSCKSCFSKLSQDRAMKATTSRGPPPCAPCLRAMRACSFLTGSRRWRDRVSYCRIRTGATRLLLRNGAETRRTTMRNLPGGQDTSRTTEFGFHMSLNTWRGARCLRKIRERAHISIPVMLHCGC